MRQLTKLVCPVEYAQQITTRLGRSMDKVFNLVSFLIYYVRPWEGFIEPQEKTLITAYFLSLNTKLIDKI